MRPADLSGSDFCCRARLDGGTKGHAFFSGKKRIFLRRSRTSVTIGKKKRELPQRRADVTPALAARAASEETLCSAGSAGMLAMAEVPSDPGGLIFLGSPPGAAGTA